MTRVFPERERFVIETITVFLQVSRVVIKDVALDTRDHAVLSVDTILLVHEGRWSEEGVVMSRVCVFVLAVAVGSVVD